MVSKNNNRKTNINKRKVRKNIAKRIGIKKTKINLIQQAKPQLQSCNVNQT